jgi:zinc protease
MNHRRSTAALAPAMIALLAFLISFPSVSFPEKARGEKTPALKKVTTIEGITEYQLDNGLRVLLFPDPSAANVTVNLTVFVGSRHEGYGETGMAHLLEHMVFKGTPTHRDIPKLLKEHGARFNGSTWVDRTNYFETMAGSDANLEFGIRLEADRMINSFVKREDLVSEMTVVRSEFEMGENSPERVLNQRMMAVAYEWHNYGKSTIGNRSDIERVPIDKLQAFYHKYYRPDNAMLVVAGKFDEAKAQSFIAKYFGLIQPPKENLDATYTDEPAQDGERRVVLRRVGKIGVVGLIYHIPAGPHDDLPATEVLNGVLVREPSGRLYKSLVETRKALSVSGSASVWHDPSVLEITAEVDPKMSLEDVQKSMIESVESPSTFTEEEVERAKRRILKDRELLMTDSNRIGVVLSEWGAIGDWRLFFLHRDRVAKVTPADVDRVAHKYLLQNNRTAGVFIPTQHPERVAVPPTPLIADLLKDYRGGKGLAAGEAFDPTPANIEKRVERSQLPGGLKLALFPKKTRGEAVVAELILRYGNEESMRGHTSATQFLASLMTRGTKKHNRQQLQDELDRLGARLRPGGLLGEAIFSIQTKRDNLIPVMELLGEMLREPTFPQEEFDILKRDLRANLERGLTEPTALAFREIQRRLNPYPPEDVRYVPTIEESMSRMDKVTVEEFHKLYAEQLGPVGELAVVGDFDPEAVKRVIQEILVNWKAEVPFQRIARPAKTDVPGSRKEILTPDKENAVYVAGEMFPLTDTDPDYPALEIANFLFGGGTLSSRLGNRVRQKEGLSYGVRSQFQADGLDKSARFSMFAICNPTNMSKVDKAIAEELDKLLKEGVQETELAEARESLLKQRQVQRANDMMLAGTLTEELFLGRTFEYDADLEKKIAALKPQDVNAAIRKHFSPEKLVIIHAGDFKKKEKK